MTTNFQKVKEFNEIFGVPTPEIPEKNVVTNNPALTKLRQALIEEECKEFVEAVTDNNFTEMIDALADILYVVYGAGAAFGVDLDKAFDIVHNSNMSKVCKTESEAIKTVEWYMENQLETYDSPDYRKSVDGKYWIVFNKSTGKILKSISYNPAKFCLQNLKIKQQP
tara:strand:- start:118 stop:618 length:501 start_codon:yes stop_codon:yes gene_type:complete